MALGAAGIVSVTFGMWSAWYSGHFYDFGVFYESARVWWLGGDPYRVRNLNPPFVVALMSPLGLLPKPLAWTVWQVTNLVALLVTVRICTRETCPLNSMALAVLISHASTLAQTQMGQIAWIVAVPIVLAWRSLRHGAVRSAGLWLGLALAAKPFLLLLLPACLVDSRWRRMLGFALATSAGIAGLTLLIAGAEPFSAWLGGRDSAWHSTSQPLNASLAATTAAAGHPAILGCIIGLGAWIPVLRRWNRLSEDARWLAALGSVLIAAPLGWIQYLSWLLPITWACWTRLQRPLKYLGIGGTLIPPVAIVLFDHGHVAYPTALVCWVAAAVLESADSRSTLESSGARERTR
jgi:hypothetical protein